MTHRFVIHGHFYQPPREEPWLELMPREPTAAPDHDWNARITRECYAPLTRARVLDEKGRVRNVINTFDWISFNVGPTLFKWFDGHAPAVRDAMIAGDKASVARTGHGNAIAQPYHHVILPLASRRDKLTEVRWGIRDFRSRFGREPQGMWLPETAVDEETLDVLIEEGIQFTILAPSQLQSVPPFGRPGRWHGAGGKTIAICSYDGPLAQDVAFSDLLQWAQPWRERMLAFPEPSDGGPTIVSVATDGETFGHHHKFGDMALAALIEQSHAELTNYSALLAANPPVDDVTVRAPTSWSCPHGIERWRSNCGCRMDPLTSQEWRTPLRAGLNVLAQGIQAVVTTEWPVEAGDRWVVRETAGPSLDGVEDLPQMARRLLEAESHSLAMFTSCAWFFDDLARLEPRIVLRHAARALEFLPERAAAALEMALLTALSLAHCNDPADGDGVNIWRRDVLVEADGPARLAAGLAALRDIAPAALDDVIIPTHTWRIDGDEIITHHRRTGVEARWRAEPVTLGVIAERTHIRPSEGGDARMILSERYPAPVRDLLREVARPMVLDATLNEDDRVALHGGLLDTDDSRDRAIAGAWRLVERDGLEAADVVVHAVLDLFDLDEKPLTDAERADAFLRLAAQPPSHARELLADRLSLVLPGAA